MNNSYFKLFSKSTKFIAFLVLLYNQGLLSQSVENIIIHQEEDNLIIGYDIYGGREYDLYKIDLTISSDGGRTFAVIPQFPVGDIGYGISRGRNKQITWEPLNEKRELVGENYVFKLNGSLLATSDDVEVLEIKGGTFDMGDGFGDGSTDETFLHTITLDDYQIGKYEVTNHQFAVFLKKYHSNTVKSGEFSGEIMIYENDRGLKFVQGEWQPVAGFEYHPVIGVTWFGANEFCQFFEMRLPTEAEWEYAAREVGKRIRFGNGKNVASSREINFDASIEDDSTYWMHGENRAGTISVGGLAPNSIGLFQMSGNVWEWCQDWYASNYYHKSKTTNPTGAWMGNRKSLRGGSWFNSAQGVRVYERSFLPPHWQASDVGFRVVKSLQKSE